MKRLFTALLTNRANITFTKYQQARIENCVRYVRTGKQKVMTTQQKHNEIQKRPLNEDMEATHNLSEVKKNLTDKYNVTFGISPTKSKNDTKEYLVMKLENGLTTLLVSDITSQSHEEYTVKTEKRIIKKITSGIIRNQSSEEDIKLKEKLAACSLTVGAGSFHDPEEVPGLAHLLEHMLFMGSEKFPKENDFNSFVTTRGGSNNAMTDCESTTFYFDCPEAHLEETMNRFANFFIAPLIKRDSLIRERQSIESEFQMHSASDVLRILQIITNTAPPNNPAHKFLWGNLKTLKENVEDDVLLNTLRDFWSTQYSAHNMTLAVQARLPISILGDWVANHFGQIPSNFKSKTLFPYIDPPFQMELFHQMYTVMPVSNFNMIRMTWALPPVQHLYKSKPTLYTSFMVGHEGKGSLMSYLKKKLWALNLVAGNGNDGTENNTMYSLFSIGILLTENGLSNLENVLHAVFSYIKMLKVQTPSRFICEEIQFIAETNFRFSPEIPPSDNVQFLSQCMQIYPEIDYMTGSRLLAEFKPEQITNFLNMLTPDRVNIMLVSKKAAKKVTLDETEEWFKAKYNMSAIPSKWINDWQTCKLDSNFFLPPPNPFIPKDFTILPNDNVLSTYPEKIRHDECIELWFKQDKKFLLPFGYINIYLISPYSVSLPQNFVMSDLFVSLFTIMYDEEVYPASVAGLIYSLSSADYGLLLSITGYNEKIQLFLEKMLDFITTFNDNITPGIFDAVKEEQRKSYYNEVLNPTALAKEIRLSVLCEPYCTSMTKLDAISMIELKKLQEFSANFFENLYVKCLIQGNISRQQSINIADTLKEKLNYEPLLQGCCPEIRVRKIPKGENIVRVRSLNDQDINCHITNYYQSGLSKTLTESCLIELLMLNMMEPLFDTLRTKEQLGYFVNNDIKYTYGVLGFSVAVKFQSDKFDVQHVESRMTEFLAKMKDDLKEMKVENFDQLRESMKLLKSQADTQLADEVDRNWSEIESNEYIFDRLKLEMDYLETVEKDDIYTYFKKILKAQTDEHDDKCLRKMSIQVDSNHSESNTELSKSTLKSDSLNNLKHTVELVVPQRGENAKINFVTNLEKFRKKMYIYPVINVKV